MNRKHACIQVGFLETRTSAEKTHQWVLWPSQTDPHELIDSSSFPGSGQTTEAPKSVLEAKPCIRRSAFPERGPALALGSRGTFCPTGATVSLGPGASEGHCDVGWGHQAVRSVDHHQRGWRWCLGVGTHTEIPDPRGGSLAGGALCGHTRVPSGDRTVDAAPQTDSNPRSFAVRRLHHHSARF